MKRTVTLILRLLLGLVFLYAAYTKLRQPWLVFALSIDSYQMLPAWAVFTVARTLPWIELVFGVMLVSGLWLRYVGPATTALLVFFYAAMLRAYFGAAGIDCGCFGVGEAVSPATLARDGALLVCSIALCFLVFKRKSGWRDSDLLSSARAT
jgi:uncharacterized membrane protein YphA (DoxX/SURF4 family)